MVVRIAEEYTRQGYSQRAFARALPIDRKRLRSKLARPGRFMLEELEPCALLLQKSLCELVSFEDAQESRP